MVRSQEKLLKTRHFSLRTNRLENTAEHEITKQNLQYSLYRNTQNQAPQQ